MIVPTRTRRPAPLVLGLAAAALLTACAATTGGPSPYTQELERLEQDCRVRGGILTPAGRGTTGRPASDFFCLIHGGPSRLQR